MSKALAICLLALAALTTGAQAARAQTAFQISGRIIDTTGAAVAQATIRLIAPPDTLTTLSNDNGSFTFHNLKTHTFRLKVTAKGFLPIAKNFDANEPTTHLPPLILHIDYQDLDPVTVSRTRPFVISGDTLSYNTAAFPVRDGAEVEDILKRLPGIEVDIDGNVIVQGKRVDSVLVNGKAFFGGNVLLAIRNLPADVVSHLQIIDDYGDKARLTGIKTGEPAKILNIVLKPDKTNGVFSNVQTAAGDGGKYDNNGFLNSIHADRQLSASGTIADNNQMGHDPNNNLNLSYADRWNKHLSGSLGTSMSGDNPQSESNTTQKSYYPGQQLSQQQSASNTSDNHSYAANGVFTLKPDNSTQFRFSPTFGIQTSRQQATSNFTNTDLDTGFSKTTNGQTVNNTTTRSERWGADLYYEKTMPLSKRRFSLQTGISGANTHAIMNDQTTAGITANNVHTVSDLDYLTTNPNNSINGILNASYFQPLTPASMLEIGYSAHSSTSLNNRITQSAGSIIDSLSSLQRYHTLVQHFHVGYLAKTNRLILDLHLEAEQGLLSGTLDQKENNYDYKYFHFLPGAQATWKLSPKRSLLFQYQGNNNIPGLHQVSPITDLTNPQYPVVGNPNLKASYLQNISVHYEQTDLKATQYTNFGLGLNISNAIHPIIPVIVHPKDSSQVIQTTTYINAGQNNSLGLSYHFTAPSLFHQHFRVTTNGSFFYNQTQTQTDNQSYLTKTLTWTQGLHLQFLIPNIIETDLQGNYSISSTTPGLLSQTATVNLNIKYYFLSHWSQTLWLTQPYIGTSNSLQTAPASLTSTIQREFLRHNRATVSITGFNLINNKVMSSQSTAGTTIYQSQTVYAGRYFLLTCIFRLQRF